jgi:hypothetical protein
MLHTSNITTTTSNNNNISNNSNNIDQTSSVAINSEDVVISKPKRKFVVT